MTFKHRSLFLVYCLFRFIFSRENSDCHNATGPHQEHDIATVRGTEVLIRILGFAPQLNPQSMKHSKLPKSKIIYKSTIDNTSNSAGMKNNGMLRDWLNCSAGGEEGEKGRGDSKCNPYATVVALSRASGLQERRMDEQQYQTALKPIRSPHTRPEKYRGVGANRTNFFSFSVCSEIWTIGTMATS